MKQALKIIGHSPEIDETLEPHLLKSLRERFDERCKHGQVEVAHLIWFLGLSKKQLDKLCGIKKTIPKKHEKKDKFRVRELVGYIKVPQGFEHDISLDLFREEFLEKYGKGAFFEKRISDDDFKKSSTLLEEGQIFSVYLCQSVGGSKTSSSSKVEFLKSHKGLLLGARGAALVISQLGHLLKNGESYLSFDEKENLLQEEGRFFVPEIRFDGQITFTLFDYAETGDKNDCFLLFQRIK